MFSSEQTNRMTDWSHVDRWWGWFSNCWKTRTERFRTWLLNGRNLLVSVHYLSVPQCGSVNRGCVCFISLGPLVSKVKEYQVETIVDTLCTNMLSDKEQLRDISSIGLKTVIGELPPASSGKNTNISLPVLLLLESYYLLHIFFSVWAFFGRTHIHLYLESAALHV